MGHVHNKKDPECLAVFAKLSEYLDGELPQGDCSHLEEHLADCPPCIDFLRSLKRSINATHEFHVTETPSPVPVEMEKRLTAAWQEALKKKPTSQA